MADWKPELREEDLQYILKLIESLKEAHRLGTANSVEPINVYSDADPIGYIYTGFNAGENYYFFKAGDRYDGEKDD